jgi:SAM-dependent methyltransferase
LSRAAPPPPLLLQEPDLFCCPSCGAPLRISPDSTHISCSRCGEAFDLEDGIPLLLLPNEWAGEEDVTASVKSFYEETPFPDYEDLDSAASLREKARQGVFARLLDEQIPDGARVLDAGCGTGQLGNFLALSPARTVVATDMCLNSLRLAQAFKLRNRIDSVTFAQMNLFRPALRPESFDLVVCNGVLHHTSAPYRGFRSLARLVKQGGFILVGLYNAWGRLPTDFRRRLFRLSGDRLLCLDPRLRGATLGEGRRRTWFQDQYRNPHESKHTRGEVLGWFDTCGFEFIHGIPKTRAFASFSENERLFEPDPTGGILDHFLVQIGMLIAGGGEGGLFVMIGQKGRPSPDRHPDELDGDFGG